MPSDFNGDGLSDILWRGEDGIVSSWRGTGTGAFEANSESGVDVSTYWQIAGTGDFNDDGYDDILWRGEAGEVGTWRAIGDGSFTYNSTAGISIVSNDWKIQGVGDFDGDGHDDILWRNESGEVGNWLGTDSGGFMANNSATAMAGNDWQIAGVGDFNKDGRDDILWRNSVGDVGTWLGTSNGGFVYNVVGGIRAASNAWHVVGTGDFNGDGYDDILWRSDFGQIGNWLGGANGAFTPNNSQVVLFSSDWHVVGTGDYNDDGRADILWRHDFGSLTEWLGRADGGFVNNDEIAGTWVSRYWDVQPHVAGPMSLHRLEAEHGEQLTGSAGADEIFGDSGDNIIIGLAGDDLLSGRYGTDIIDGGSGNDTFTDYAGVQNDQLTGGTGSDLFHFAVIGSTLYSTPFVEAVAATITDFQSGVDRIDLRLIGIWTNDDNLYWLGSGAFTGQNRVEARFADGVLEVDFDSDQLADLILNIAAPVSPLDITFSPDPWGY